MTCINHPASAAATVRCASCLGLFCRDCVELDGTFFYCAGCRRGHIPAGGAAAGRTTAGSQAPPAGPQFLLDLPGSSAAPARGVSAPPGPVQDVRTASLGRRGIAFLVDAAIVVFAVILALTIVGDPGTTATLLIAFGLPFVYEALFVQQTGQTIGKGMLGVEVVSAEGGRTSDVQAWIRGFFKVAQLGCCGVLYLSTLGSGQRLGLHDRIAGTRVVRGGRRGAEVSA